MHVQFWGAARTVTGSMHLVSVGGKKLLLDAGLFQGNRKEAYLRNRDIPFDGHEIDAIILSHAHVDHCGNIPSLVRSGFDGNIFSTSATRELASIMLLDSAKIQESDTKYVNKKRRHDGKEPWEPLYVTQDAVNALKLFRSVGFHKWFDVMPGVKCRFHVAGHMLGAAIVELRLTEDGRTVNLLFSGDLGRPSRPILRDPESVSHADFLIMESTYGDRLHPEEDDADPVLIRLINRAIEQRGKIIVPAFSVGRTQEIVYRMNNLVESGQVPSIKVFVDSPMAVDATDVFRANVECFDEEMIERILEEEDQDPLNFKNLFYVRSSQYSKKLNNFNEPCMIISASGMCESGRVVHHLRNNISDPRNTVLFTGYQAPSTTGRHILDGNKTVRFFREEYPIRAHIEKLEGSSGHADQRELVSWAKSVCDTGNVQKIALVHCEMDSATVLKEKLSEVGISNVIIPNREHILPLD
ncbi:MAG: MBL fold metallo-hydrolase [Pirellulaceae bacterium]